MNITKIAVAAFVDELSKISSALEAGKAVGKAAGKLPLTSMAVGGALALGANQAHKDWRRGREMRRQMSQQQGY